MNFTKKKGMHKIFKNTKNEHTNIINGYDSKKYLNKIYTSKTKRNIKTRDKHSNKITIKNYKINYNTDNELYNSLSLSDTSLTNSLKEIYCNIKDNTLEDYISIEIMDNLDKSDWTFIDVK